jgi:hypothetical protein
MSEFLVTSGLSGARERNRTADLRITSALLYRLSYSGLPALMCRERYRTPTPWRRAIAMSRAY